METTEHLTGALDQFHDAVHGLVGTRAGSIETDSGYRRVAGDSLYVLMRDSITGVVRESEGSSDKRSTPPLWLDCASWLDDCDRTVRSWWLDGSGPHREITANRLFNMSDAGWRPQDIPVLLQAVRVINKWIIKAENLLDGEHRWSLAANCPACGVNTVSRRDGGGEWVRQPALQVGASGANCANCEAFWTPDRFLILAAALGCEDMGVLK